ncbi:MAG: hypothetical protein VKI42_09815 [Synechococcaceae cyanobacterium]|nr:hypothetical protein [Synechococcaceae cyanobacterium]
MLIALVLGRFHSRRESRIAKVHQERAWISESIREWMGAGNLNIH